MPKFLIYLRRGLAALFGGMMLLYCLDFLKVIPMPVSKLFHLQLVPAIMAGMLVIVAGMFLLTLIFGRVYCSVLCPLGIMQDFILRVKIWWLRLSKKGRKMRMKYAPAWNLIRYGVLIITVVPMAFGLFLPILLLDPYSNFARITITLFRPIIVAGNNLLSTIMTSMGKYSVYQVEQINSSPFLIAFSAAILLVIVVMVWRRGRLWCNTICPVGTVLGLVSKVSLFRVTLDHSKCNGCTLCAGSCKAQCIDCENKKVDTSRCVTCFNCLDKCKRDAIGFRASGWKITKISSENGSNTDKTNDGDDSNLTLKGLARRRFIKGTAVTAITVVGAKIAMAKAAAQSEIDSSEVDPYANNVDTSVDTSSENSAAGQIRNRYPLPPGAHSLERFKDRCTACQLCVSKCPTHVLQPAFLENGLTGMMQPFMQFKIERFCNYECKECIDVCPNGAIMPISLEEKKLTRVGNVNFLKQKCIVNCEHQDCGACAEHCPTQAVHMVPFGDSGLTIPEVTPELCIGCGGCESICPVSPPAIFVEGLLVQERAAVPSQDKIEKVEVNDFGF